MTKQNSIPEYVTREILKEEISASEKRLDAKIDSRYAQLDTKIDSCYGQLDAKIESTSQSLKDYTDSRFTQLNTMITQLDRKISQTMRGYQKDILHVLSNHEERITGLEGRVPQPGRI